MKILKAVISPLWKILFVISFAVPFLVLFPFFYFGLVTRRYDFVFRLKRLWSRLICLGSFLYPVVRYKSKKYHLPKPCIIVSNHTSYLDICFSPFYIDHTAVYMGKYELLRVPLFRYF